MVSVWRSATLIAAACGSAYGGSMLMARPVAPAPMAPPDERACPAPRLGEGAPDVDPLRVIVPWDEVEGEWRGKWTPVSRDDPGHYRAVWRRNVVGTTGVTADLRIRFTDSNTVKITRTGPEGQCIYHGKTVGDGWRVAGTYTCDWHRDPLPWSAAIGPGYRPASTPCNTGSPQLTVPWRETEGDWRGTWQPYGGGNGAYRGRWAKGAEGTSGNLQITIAAGNVTIVRSQAEGQCRYTGRLMGNGWRAAGTYTCDWHPGTLPWSAVIGTGNPPPPGSSVADPPETVKPVGP